LRTRSFPRPRNGKSSATTCPVTMESLDIVAVSCENRGS
jgi:hypothetical protein